MAGTAKGHHTGEEGGAGSSEGVFEPSMDKFPVHIISCILEKLDLESVCTAACVSPTFSSAAAQVFPSLSSLDLSVRQYFFFLIECPNFIDVVR